MKLGRFIKKLIGGMFGLLIMTMYYCTVIVCIVYEVLLSVVRSIIFFTCIKCDKSISDYMIDYLIHNIRMLIDKLDAIRDRLLHYTTCTFCIEEED